MSAKVTECAAARLERLLLAAGLAACDGFNHVLGVDYCGPTLRSTASAFRTKACNLDNPQALVRLRQLPGLAVGVLAGEGERAAQELVVGVGGDEGLEKDLELQARETPR
eukprot:CAMPEP_0179463734 /NCGR_PEP_ID=MMETSP0799-20121207/45710_1 /TAXON_ID=46947 /ORGANISM="Geminigera cryophila, Strain CCMP2564" /LENGTH=109 /DNA_ID=CAMNT_0021267133 /DNA_START=75 /DNA_END=405 /DNA_ORIENTATION=+